MLQVAARVIGVDQLLVTEVEPAKVKCTWLDSSSFSPGCGPATWRAFFNRRLPAARTNGRTGDHRSAPQKNQLAVDAVPTHAPGNAIDVEVVSVGRLEICQVLDHGGTVVCSDRAAEGREL